MGADGAAITNLQGWETRLAGQSSQRCLGCGSQRGNLTEIEHEALAAAPLEVRQDLAQLIEFRPFDFSVEGD